MEVKDFNWKLVLKTTVNSIISAAGNNSETISGYKGSEIKTSTSISWKSLNTKQKGNVLGKKWPKRSSPKTSWIHATLVCFTNGCFF